MTFEHLAEELISEGWGWGVRQREPITFPKFILANLHDVS